jgi:hypothetical protein
MWHVAHTGKRRNVYRFFGGESKKERDYFKDTGVDGRIILN